nr:MAG TPA: hypothetical protein [Caudoviricetes sp.]
MSYFVSLATLLFYSLFTSFFVTYCFHKQKFTIVNVFCQL